MNVWSNLPSGRTSLHSAITCVNTLLYCTGRIRTHHYSKPLLAKIMFGPEILEGSHIFKKFVSDVTIVDDQN